MIGLVSNEQSSRKGAQTIKISVTRTGKDSLEQMAARYGMKEQEIGGRVYDWFMGQDSIVQRAVLGMLEDLEVDAARRFMEKLAGAGAVPLVVEPSAKGNGATAQPPSPGSAPRHKAPSARSRPKA